MPFGVSQVGSLADLGTFVLVVYALRHEIRPHLNTMAAGLVALARNDAGVDDDRLQDELDVDESEVEAVQPTIIACGGEREDD
jgi:hypothetical protein